MAEVKPKLHRFQSGIKGYLVKQGKVFKQWRPRYFVLEKKKLKYYMNDMCNNLLGEILIDESIQMYDVLEDVENMKFLFYLIGKNISGQDEVLFLSAINEKEKLDWIEAITDSVHDGFKQIFQPDLWSNAFYPTVDLAISYSHVNSFVENGNILRPSQIDSSPDVLFKSFNSEEKYSFIMLDIDYISLDNPANKYFLHWGVINFTGGDVKTGDELAPYLSPAPVYNSGLHRYFFLVFKQKASISPIVLNEIVELFLKRDGFPFMKWVRLMDFGDPIGINGFYSGWEEYCDILHANSSYIPPEGFRSPSQEAKFSKSLESDKCLQAKLDLYKDMELKDIFGFEADKLKDYDSHTISLEIFVGQAEKARDGVILTIDSVQEEPVINLSTKDEFLYTLLMIDPDFPSRINPSQRECLHWLIVNIDDLIINKGNVLIPYIQPSPYYSTGLHRYVFVLYRQKNKLSEYDLKELKNELTQLKGFKIQSWIERHHNLFFPIPVSLEAFLSEWGEILDDVHKKLNILPPISYRSPSQILEIKTHSEDFEEINDVKIDDPTQSDYYSICQSKELKFRTVSNNNNLDNDKFLNIPLNKDSIPTPQNATKMSNAISSMKPSSRMIDESEKRNVDINLFLDSISSSNSNLFDKISNQQITIKQIVEDELIETTDVQEKKTTENKIVEEKIESYEENIEVIIEEDPFLLENQSRSSHTPFPSIDPFTPLIQNNSKQLDLNDTLYSKPPMPPKSPRSGKRNSVQRSPSMHNILPGSSNNSISKDNLPTMDEIDKMLSPDYGTVHSIDEDDDNSVVSKLSSLTGSTLRGNTDERKKPTQSQKDDDSSKSSGKFRRLISQGSIYYKPLDVLGTDRLPELKKKLQETTDSTGKCSIFDISTPSVFDGEIMKKKFSTDFMFKESIIWIEPITKSLHWAKSLADRRSPSNSKFIFLDRVNPYDLNNSEKPLGEMKGLFKTVEQNGTNITINLENGEFLELKLSTDGSPPAPKRAADWVKVIRAFTEI